MANQRTRIIGFDKVKKNLDREIRAIKGRTLAGLIEAQILIRRDMSITSPTVPIDLRNLDHSYFAVTSKGAEAGGAATFVGDDSGTLQGDHSAAVAEAKSLVQSKKARGEFLIMGFSANYAAFVHEMPEDTNWSKEGSGAKFFEKALSRNTPKILKIIADNARIK